MKQPTWRPKAVRPHSAGADHRASAARPGRQAPRAGHPAARGNDTRRQTLKVGGETGRLARCAATSVVNGTSGTEADPLHTVGPTQAGYALICQRQRPLISRLIACGASSGTENSGSTSPSPGRSAALPSRSS